MKELMEYRQRLIERLAEAAHEFTSACQAREPLSIVADSAWTVHQFASHVRDVDAHVYGERIHRTLRENEPLFKNFDADQWMAAHYDPDEAFEQILAQFDKSVTDLCTLLADLPQAAWSRVSRHDALGGGLTLQLWVERSLAHIEEHLKALK